MQPGLTTTTHVPRAQPAGERRVPPEPDAATHTVMPGHLSTRTNVRRAPAREPEEPAVAPRRHPALVAIPIGALVGLVLVAVAVFLPWHAGGGGLAHGIAGIGLLAVTAGLGAGAVADLVAGRLSTTGLVVVPTLAVLAGLAASAVAAAAAGTSFAEQLGLAPDLDGLGPEVMLVGLVVTTVAGVLAVVGFVRDWGGDPGAPVTRSPRRTAVVASAAVGTIVLLGVSAAVLTTVAVPVAPSAPVGGDPATFVGGTGTLSGVLPTTPAVTPSYGGPMPATGCPAVAQATMPELAGAVLVGRSPSVAVALCQGASGRLYYFGANPTTRMTLTLPATRTASTWTASDRGLTYVITETQIAVQRDGAPVADEPLTGGW